MVNKHRLGLSFLLRFKITLKSQKELHNFQFNLHKMIEQSLKLGKCMTDQVANTSGHVRWLSVSSTIVLCLYFLISSLFKEEKVPTVTTSNALHGVMIYNFFFPHKSLLEWKTFWQLSAYHRRWGKGRQRGWW